MTLDICGIALKTQATEAKQTNGIYNQTKNLYRMEEIIYRVEGQPGEWEEYLQITQLTRSLHLNSCTTRG